MDKKYFLTYAKTRRITFFIQTFLIFCGLLAYIILDVLKDSGLHYIEIIFSAVGCCLICGIDFHWSNVVFFHATHPNLWKRPIKWLNSDSEP